MDRWEIKLYELLGVRLFRRLALGLERLIHRRDRRKNTNYHIAAPAPGALEAYQKYLLYNAVLHGRGIFFVGILLLIKWSFWGFSWYIDLLLLLLAVQDGYCIMLQRYNFLRIRQRMAVLEKKQVEKLCRCAAQLASYLQSVQYDKAQAREDAAFLTRLRQCIRNQENLVLTDEDLKRLVSLKQLLGSALEGGDS